MVTLYLFRKPELKDRTLGELSILGREERFVTLELPNRANKRNISCIKAGIYPFEHRTSLKYGLHLILKGVAGRSYILVHNGCFPKHTRGCILIGTEFKDLDGDKVMDVANSRDAMKELMRLLNGENGVLVIIDPVKPAK